MCFLSVFSHAIQRLFEFLCYMSSHVQTNILLVLVMMTHVLESSSVRVFSNFHTAGCCSHWQFITSRHCCD
jgi:hypothetical protein